MTKPEWRKWFKRAFHAVSFAMRVFFAFSGFAKKVYFSLPKLKNRPVLLKKLLNSFSIKNHKKGLIFVSLFLILIASSLIIFFATTAKAEKEVHAYISASIVSGEGVENPLAAQLQDFSVDARFSDFTTDLSARVAFGIYTKTVDEKKSEEVNSNSSSSTSTIDVAPVIDENNSTSSDANSLKDNTVTFLHNNLFSLEKLFSIKTIFAQENSVLNEEASSSSQSQSTSIDNVTSSSSEIVTDTNASSSDSSNSTEGEDVFVKEDRDPFKVASCTTFSKTCHLVVFEGFGVGSELAKYPVKSAELKISLAGRAAPSEISDRIVVRAYKDGRWNYLGEQIVRGEFDNAIRGGYVSLPISIDSWSDLATMIVAVEYVREGDGDAVVLIDSAWVDVGFATEESPDDLALYSPNVKSALLARDAERRAKERDHLELNNGQVIDFKNTLDGLNNAKLRVATTKLSHSVLGEGEEYVSVTNYNSSPEKVHLSFYFPEEGGRITEISKYTHNSPYSVVESKNLPIAYYCENGWAVSTSSDEVINNNIYYCNGTNEPHVCSSINDDKTSCLSELSTVGKEEVTAYRRFFEPDTIFTGSYTENQSIIGEVVNSIFNDIPSNAIPASHKEKSYSGSFELDPGATKYFRIGYNTPLNTRGDIYIKAESDGGSYGLVKTEYDGSWNWRIPIDIGLPYKTSVGEVAVPISLNKMPLAFWSTVNENGSDIRFGDEDGLTELPFWISSFNKNKRSGHVWVRLPNGSGIMPRIFLYAGNEDSEVVYKPYNPFISSELTKRAVVVSNGVENISVQITALAPHVRVSVGSSDERTLLYGEVALFENISNSSIIYSTGPVAARASSVFSRATIVPLGLSSMDVSMPSEVAELGIATGQGENGFVTIGDKENEIVNGVVFRTPVSDEKGATSSVPTVFVADSDVNSYILRDNSFDERLDLSSSVVLDKKANGVRATCSSDRFFGAYDLRGGLLATSSCNSILNGPFDEGTIISVFYGSTSTPFSAVFSAVYNNEERIILNSDINSRNSAGYDPEIAFGEPEYVIPGEHRVFDLEFNKDKPHITRFLSKQREFNASEIPSFKFQYKPQSSNFFRTLRSFIGLPPFKIENVVVEQDGNPLDIKTVIEYTGNLEWTVKLDKKESERISPGKLTLKMQIKEGTSVYEDSYDFYWGLLSINFNKAIYERGETAEISLGALSESGNTICNAKLKLFVTDSASSSEEIVITPSGKCDGNNIVDVPDYSAKWTPADIGTYSFRLIRLDDDENIIAEVRDSFKVVTNQPYIIERSGPTRINPTAHYEMTIKVVSKEGYEGELIERIPSDFEIINRGGSTLKWADSEMTEKLAVWNVNMKAGEVYQFTYTFDAPDKSPFIYFLGPATIGDGDSSYTEPRKWMIASDAAGKMIIFWSSNTITPPAASWSCVSCGGQADNTFVNRWPMGSSTATYGTTGGASSHQPGVTASVGASSGQTGNVNGGGTALVYKDHSHTFTTPTITVGDHKPPSKSLRMYKNINAGDFTVPQGAILLFETLPGSGWTEYSTMNGFYPYGAATAGNSTGTASHSHTVSGTTDAPIGGGVYASNNRLTAVSNSTHTHTVTSTTTNTVINDAPYVTYRMASINATGTLPNGAIALWDGTPATGWIDLSGPGGVLENKFVKVATSSLATGGVNSHVHSDILGVTTGAAVGTTQVPNGSANPFGSAAAHTHTVDYTSWTSTTNLPPYATVTFGKRAVGISVFKQEGFRFYDNVNDILPTDPWPAGDTDVTENNPIEDTGYRIKPGSTFRVRMAVNVTNATSSIGTNQLKLQYSTDGNCATALNWNDVGAPGSGTALRGYDNNLVSNGATLSSRLLTTSTLSALQYYSESSASVGFVREAGMDTYAEFDWVLNANTNLASSSRHCLRMVENSGTVFSAYNKYPSFLSNSAPNIPTLIDPFNHAKLLSLTPQLSFTAADDEGNTMHYAVEIDDDPNFGSPLVSQSTVTHSDNFSNITNPSNKAPYSNGDKIAYQVQAATLTNGSTYWWRVKAMDPVGSTQYGAWSTPKAFTIDTSLTASAWYQTTDAQFLQNSLTGITITSNSARLTTGSTTGSIYSQEIVFDDGALGTVWGNLVFTDDGGSGITYQVEYKDSSDNWNLVPNSILANNSTGFGTSPVSLNTIDPLVYPILRLRANYTNSGTPILYDWGVTWDYKTLAPVMSSLFNNAKTSTTTPTVSFASIDPLGRSITYELQYSTDPTFTSSTTCNSGGACSAGFKNVSDGSDTSPFNSSSTIEFKFQSALTNGTTYFWRVRGAGAVGSWSFWSEVRSFTVDTSANRYPTWFQTMRGQWNMDTLSGTYTNAGNSVAVATTSDKVLIVYGKGTEDKPKYRFYEAGVLGTEKDMLSIGSSVLWSVAKASPASDQFIVGTMGSSRSIKFQVYEDGIWSRMITFPQSGPHAQRRSFSTIYESKSGKALAVSCNGTNADYAVFDGSSWGSVSTVNLGFANSCELVRLASNPIKNEVIAVFRDTGLNYHVEVWDGTAWSSTNRFNFSTAAGMSETAHDGMAVEYEANSGRAVVVVSRRTTRGFVWRMWNGTTWGTETNSNNLGNNTSAQFEWGNLKRSPTSNDLMLCAISQYADNDDGAFTDHVRWNSGTSAWANTKLGQYYPYTRHGQSMDCEFETRTGRTGRLITVGDESWTVPDGASTLNRSTWDSLNISANTWQSGSPDTGRRWNYSGTTYNWNATETWTNKTERAVSSGDILNIGLARNTTNYIFSVWNGTTWTTPSSLASASVTTKPFGQPFDMASQDGFNQGRVYSTPINFADGNAPSWRQIRVSSTTPASTKVLVSVEYLSGSDWLKIPDSQIPGNSVGATSSIIDLTNVNSQTYNKIRLRADLQCNGFASCPTLDDWTLEWTEGLTVSGFARAADRVTPLTSGTVKVAVNGIEQAGKTGTISATGTWSITGVNFKVGDPVTVWIDNPGVQNRAVSVVKFTGAGNLANVELSRKWLTVGDTGQSGLTIENSEIGLFDNNNESGTTRADIFFNVDGSKNLNICNTGNCSDFSLSVATGTTWRPNSSSPVTNTVHSLNISGSLIADGNTIKVGGFWRNSGSFSSGNSTVLFNATSSANSINNTGATLYKFNNVTFGEVATPAIWQLATQLYVNGNLTINYGAFSPLAQSVSIEKNLVIGSSGTFTKGTATTTFLGSTAASWSDSTVSSQDIGNVLVDGSPKTLNISSSVRATNIQIESGDTLSFGVNNLILSGSFTNNGIVSGGTGKLTMSPSASAVIKQGGYNLNDVIITGGTVSWAETVATTTGSILVSGGTVTFPSNQLYVAGSFNQTAGTFTAPNTLIMNASSPGKQIAPISNLTNIQFNGTGGWAFGSNATSTGNITMLAGTVTLPPGTLSIAGNFVNTGADINPNNGKVRFYGGAQNITLTGEFLNDINTSSGSTLSWTESHATTTGSLTAELGSTLNFPNNGSITVGGSLLNYGTMNANASALYMNRASGISSILAGSMVLSKLYISGGGTFGIFGNTRISSDFSLGTVGSFTMESGSTLQVDGFFTNTATNVSTTWTGSTLRLTSGATMSANTKSTGGDFYNSIVLDNGTQLRLWNSSSSAVTTNATSSLYGQNWAGVNGALRIYGTYYQNGGSAYWSYDTDFDGTPLGASGRVVTVNVNNTAVLNFSSSSILEMLGNSSGTTTLKSISGVFDLNIATSTLRARYSSIRALNTNGINISGSSSLDIFDNNEVILDTNNGYGMTLARETINANNGKQYYNDVFVNGLGVTTYNVRVINATANFIRFKQHSGNRAGEANDADVSGNPGEVRWDDSNYVISVAGTVYSDLGVTRIGAPVCDGATNVVRLQVSGGASYQTTCAAGTSAFTFPAVSFSGETVMTVYLGGNALNKAVTVTRGASTNLNGIDLYKDRVIVRHEDTLAMTNSALSTFDADNNADVMFTSNGGNFSFATSTMGVYIWPSKTWTPGGNVTLLPGGPATVGGRLQLGTNSIYNAGNTDQITIGGDFRLENGAQFNSASSTIIFNPSDTRTISAVAAFSLNNLRFTGTGTSSLTQTITVNGNLDLASGGLTGSGSITINGNATGNGNLSMTSGTITMPNGGIFGGANPWAVYNLTLGNGTLVATTTKNGVGTTTVRALLTVRANHHYDMNSIPHIFSGAGNAMLIQGSVNASNTTITYSPSTNINVADINYYNIQFTGNGTSTLPAVKLDVLNNFVVGDGSSNSKVTGLSNDPEVTINGDIIIRSNSLFIASDAAPINVKGNWTNQGTFNSSIGTVRFIGSGNKTINPGLSPFGSVLFADNNGSWTIAQNATATNLTIGSSTSFKLDSGRTLEVTGNFRNLVGGASTDWTGSTLYLNTTTRNEVNPKDAGSDIYNIVQVGAGTQAVFWNSSSTQFITANGGGVLSQDHANVNGDLYIFGNYQKTTGGEYWSYLVDFDGEIFDIGNVRQARVRFASSSSATYSGTSNLEVYGKPFASTTITSLSGTYGLSIGGSTSTIRYSDFSNVDTNGVSFVNSVKVTQMDDVSFSNSSGVGSMITLAGSVITANPLRTTYNNSFNASNGTNIRVTGSTMSAWRIRNHYGNRAGEAYDNDPAGDPGYVIWDDSAAMIYVSGKVYESDGTTVSNICNGSTQNVFLKVEGAGTLTSACDSGDGSYMIGPIVYAPYDTLTVYTTTGSVAYAYRPITNISDMDLYENTVIVRNEQEDSITNTGIDSYDKDQDATLLARVTGSNLVLDSNTKLIVWDAKSFAPGGNVSVPGNTNISSVDGDLEIRQSAEWKTNGTEQYTIGGDFTMGSNAKVLGNAGEFIFTSSVAGKNVSASTPITLTSINFNGSGSWTMSGVATTTENVRIQSGTVTLPNGSLAIGGDFNNQASFNSNSGSLIFTATTTGKQIRSNGSSFGSISFIGTGSWSFLDNATTTGNFTIASGTPTLPSGTLSVGGDFENIAGSFNANNGSITVRGSGSNRKVVPGGSSFNNLRIENGSYSTNMLNATATGDLIIASGSLDLPIEQLTIGGTFRNSGTFTAGVTSTVKMIATSTGKIINPGSSEFNNLTIEGAGGGFTIEANTTVNKDLLIKQASGFTVSPTVRLVVKGQFTNNIGGTWTNSTLRLEKAGSFSINGKNDGAASYGTIELGPNVKISSWKSSYSTTTPESGASLYSQNDGNVSGSLKIYGSYVKSSGTDYWSAGRDFDNSVISSRQVNVRIANGATVTYSGGTLEAVGESGRITTIQSISGNYGLEVNNSVFKGNYFRVRNVNTSGFKLTGTTTIVSFDNADLATGVDTGRILHIDATVIDQNTGSVFSNDSFALDSGHTSGTNVYLNGTTNNAITFTNHSGGLDGEGYDSDGATGCGAVRWDDSSCQFIDQRYYRWRNDNGTEAVPDGEWFGGASSGWTHRQRVHVVNNSNSSATNVAVKIALPYQAQMKSDFSDLRFTANDGTTTISHWTEKYSAASDATVWVKIPQLSAKSSYDAYVYYGNTSTTSVSDGPNTFTFIYDAENGTTGMSGDTSSFMTSSGPTPIPPYNSQVSPNYLRALDMSGRTDGMANTSAGVSRGTTIRERIYVNGTENDDACLTFGVGSPITNNWGFCVSPQRTTNSVRLVKNAKRDGMPTTNASSTVASYDGTLSTVGWYSARIDWETSGSTTAKLYDPSGNEIVTLSGNDSHNPGSGIGFTFWYQHGAWDNVTASPFLPGDPTVIILTPQQHGGATWKASENTAFMTAYQNDVMRLRFGIRNTGTTLNSQQFRLDYAVKGTYPNCESVPDGNYSQVQPVSSCGGSDVCMATSSNFVDNDATTPLLSTPKGLNYVQGRMVESPSNMTSGYTVNSNTFTEVEYAVKFTSSAVQPSYCMRVSNDGTRLVSYTKVAEAGLLQPPSISNWNITATPIYLTEGTTTRVMATGTVTDFNTASDISSATGTIYRSGVAGGANCSPNYNNCYSGASTTCSLTSCSGLSCTVSCYADLQFFAENTDIGTYSAENWRADVTVKDTQSLSDTDSAVSELMQLKALTLQQSSIDYGDVEVGSSTPSGSNPMVRLQNTGNTGYSLLLDGSDLSASGSLIPVDRQSFATSTFAIGSCSLCEQLSSTTPVAFGLTLQKPNSTTAVTGDIYFGIQVPFGTKAMTHSGLVNIEAD